MYLLNLLRTTMAFLGTFLATKISMNITWRSGPKMQRYGHYCNEDLQGKGATWLLILIWARKKKSFDPCIPWTAFGKNEMTGCELFILQTFLKRTLMICTCNCIQKANSLVFMGVKELIELKWKPRAFKSFQLIWCFNFTLLTDLKQSMKMLLKMNFKAHFSFLDQLSPFSHCHGPICSSPN